MRGALAVLPAALLLAGCGQKGSLYLPDQGIEAVPATAPAAATGTDAVPTNPTTSGGAGGAAPVTPASPDRDDASRKRVPSPPDPAKSP